MHLGPEWSRAHAYRLLQTFESIPQRTSSPYEEASELSASVWWLTNHYLLNDIGIEYRYEERIVKFSEATFVNATLLLAEIDEVQRLQRAVVGVVTDDGTDRYAIDQGFGGFPI